MEVEEKVEEEELAEFLPDDTDGFIECLHELYGEKIIAWIGKKSLGVLSEFQLQKAYQETLIATWKKVKDPNFDPKRPLRMVFAIAEIKALDARRKKYRRPKKRPVPETEVTNFIISDLQNSDLRLDWQLADEEEKARLQEALPGIVAELPEKQRAAAVAFLECYEEIRPKNLYKPLARAMSEATGGDVTVDAAKSAWRGAVEKIRSELVRRDIGFIEWRER